MAPNILKFQSTYQNVPKTYSIRPFEVQEPLVFRYCPKDSPTDQPSKASAVV
jgi:hypothetical protein